MGRRDLLRFAGLASISTGLGLVEAGGGGAALAAGSSGAAKVGDGYFKANDGSEIHYKDWGQGAPVIFLTNWGLHSEMWQYQMTPMVRRGFRCIAIDRRGTGRSSQSNTGYDYDTLADDLSALIELLDLQNVTLVGHSMGNGETVRYLTRHGSSRIARVVMVAPTLPFLMKTADNPEGLDKAGFDQMRADWLNDMPKWVALSTVPYFKAGTSPEMMAWVAQMALECPLRTAYELSFAWSETDFRSEVAAITLPVLLIQGDKDTLPINITGDRVAKMIRKCDYRIYEDEAHGLMFTSSERLNKDLETFIRG